MSIRIGMDVGGTFTDVTGYDDARDEIVITRKYLSNPGDQMTVMERIAADLAETYDKADVSLVLHGSTAALNTLLEGKGVRVGLITTAGFRDVYEIGRQWRGDEVFNMFAPAPKMLTTRDLIKEARGRLGPRGNELVPLEADDIRRAARELVDAGVAAIAVCFLFSYANPAHERAARAIIADVAPGLYVSLSSDVNPEWREYERTASTVANAYIGPPVTDYVTRLDGVFHRHFPAARTLMMKSDGGAASAGMLSSMPIQTVMSGPVAGVIGGRFVGQAVGIENIITFDTGGTSSDMAVLPGEPLFRSEVAVARHPLRTRTVDIDTIGAGGGSIGSVQLGGVLKMGPESAGANPGPACYNRGGTEPTLTDALVVLGHLSSVALVEGAMPIVAERALQAVTQRIAEPLGMTPIEAALGMLKVLATNCISAMRTITVERGYDPREFALLPFGGMGPTIAGAIAPDLGLGRILVPRNPGTFSAWGMLVTDVRQERSVTRLVTLETADPAELEAVFADLEAHVTRDLEAENMPRETILTVRQAGVRYRGQSYDVTVAVPSVSDRAGLDEIARRFHDAHLRRYGHMAANQSVEIVSFKVTGIGMLPKPALRASAVDPSARLPGPVEVRRAHFEGHGAVTTPVYRRSDLAAGTVIEGPAVIEEKTSTVVVYPGQRATVDQYLMIDIAV